MHFLVEGITITTNLPRCIGRICWKGKCCVNVYTLGLLVSVQLRRREDQYHSSHYYMAEVFRYVQVFWNVERCAEQQSELYQSISQCPYFADLSVISGGNLLAYECRLLLSSHVHAVPRSRKSKDVANPKNVCTERMFHRIICLTSQFTLPKRYMWSYVANTYHRNNFVRPFLSFSYWTNLNIKEQLMLPAMPQSNRRPLAN
jgi:hypothetical protein